MGKISLSLTCMVRNVSESRPKHGLFLFLLQMTNVNTKVIKESKMQLKIVEQYINEKVCKIKKVKLLFQWNNRESHKTLFKIILML